jgi:hypothetical protein
MIGIVVVVDMWIARSLTLQGVFQIAYYLYYITQVLQDSGF